METYYRSILNQAKTAINNCVKTNTFDYHYPVGGDDRENAYTISNLYAQDLHTAADANRLEHDLEKYSSDLFYGVDSDDISL